MMLRALASRKKICVLWLLGWFGTAAALSLVAALNGTPALHHHLTLTLHSPELSHPLGFDAFGRDLLLITLHASLTSSLLALVALAISLLVATAAGTSLAIASAPVQFLGLRSLETLLAFPSLLFSLAWAAVRGPGWSTLAFSLLLATMPSLIRLVYARARELRTEDYVLAAQALGASPIRIAQLHLLPGVLGLCRVKAPNLVAGALIAEATFSFLGIGAPIGHDSWGTLLAQGKDYLIEAPHLAIGTGLPLVLTLLSLQILGNSAGHRSGQPSSNPKSS